MTVILYKIGVYNWDPTNHGSCNTLTLVNLLYQIIIITGFDFGEHVFAQVLKQVKAFAIKFPLAFPSLISDILIK